MYQYHDFKLGTDGTSESVMVSGTVDVWIFDLSAGSITMQVLFPASSVSGEPTWRDFPSGSFSSPMGKTLYIGEEQVRIRFVGTGNTDGSYIRVGRE